MHPSSHIQRECCSHAALIVALNLTDISSFCLYTNSLASQAVTLLSEQAEGLKPHRKYVKIKLNI